jgi:hypothetical protein
LSAKDIPGTYIASYPHGYEVLLLSADGSYEQRYTPSNSPTWTTNQGTWEFLVEPHNFVHLKGALLFSDEIGNRRNPPIRSDVSLAAESTFKEIDLIINDEADLSYKKQTLAKATKPQN